MRRTLALSPLALFASACASRPWTPSRSADEWSAPPSGTHQVDLPSRTEAMRRWMLPASNPWSPYAKYTLLAALADAPGAANLPDVESLDDVQRARAAAVQLASSGLPPDTLWIVDLRGPASVAFGAELASSRFASSVYLVPTFNNWPGSHEIIPAEETLAALVTMSPGVAGDSSEGSHPVFLLDAWRMAHRFDLPPDDTYDNRYALSVADLPDVEVLRARGIRRVAYVVGSLDETTVEEDDLHPAFLAWQRAGIEMAMMDLDWLALPVNDLDWDDVFHDLRVIAQPRTTIFGEPWFYRRAHGGFGGVRALPSAVSVAHGGASGAHGGGG